MPPPSCRQRAVVVRGCWPAGLCRCMPPTISKQPTIFTNAFQFTACWLQAAGRPGKAIKGDAAPLRIAPYISKQHTSFITGWCAFNPTSFLSYPFFPRFVMEAAPSSSSNVYSDSWDQAGNAGHRFNVLFPNLGALVLIRAGGGGCSPCGVKSWPELRAHSVHAASTFCSYQPMVVISPYIHAHACKTTTEWSSVSDVATTYPNQSNPQTVFPAAQVNWRRRGWPVLDQAQQTSAHTS
jgi:hypothetical protein